MKKILHHLANDWYKYLLELIVITAGVLGAFMLNGWKEQQDQKEQTRKVYQYIKDDLLSDIGEIDSAMADFEKRLAHLQEIIDGELAKADYQNSNSYFLSFFGYEDLNINQRGLTMLNNTVDLNNERSTLLANDIAQFYDNHLTEIVQARNELSDDFAINYQYWTTQNWFIEAFYKQNLQPFSEFAYENQAFRNRLGGYRIILDLYVDYLKMFQTEATETIKKIDTYLEETE